MQPSALSALDDMDLDEIISPHMRDHVRRSLAMNDALREVRLSHFRERETFCLKKHSIVWGVYERYLWSYGRQRCCCASLPHMLELW